MTEDDVRQWFAALSAGDVSPLAERMAEDVALEFPGSRFGGRYEGKRAVVVFLRQNQRLFRGGLRFDVRWVGLAGSRAVCQWTNAGTTRDGADYANRGVTLFELDGEHITAIHDYLDTERIAATWPPRG